MQRKTEGRYIGKKRVVFTKAKDALTGIEGYRFVPNSESWTRSDGVVFHGEMVTPWKDYAELDAAQREYERKLLAEYAEALKVVGVTV